MKWTENQQEAILTRGKNILVSAAAGSGKTAVLTERIIRLIVEDKENIDSMLILTFTNAAANEMKSRIRTKILEYMSMNPADVHIKRQLDLITQSNISTMHAFCINLIRENFELLDIDPNFSIGNSSIISILKDKAIQEIFDERYGDEEMAGDYDCVEKKRKDFIKLLDIYSKKNSDEEIIKIVYQMYNFIQSKKDTVTWLYNQVELYKEDNYGNIYIDYARQNINDIIKKLKNNIKKAIELCDNYAIVSYKETLENDLSDAVRLENIIKEGYNEFVDAVLKLELKRLSTKKKDKDGNPLNEDDDYKKIIKNIRDIQIKENGFNKLKEYDIKSHNMTACYDILYSLCELVEDFALRFMQKKMEKNTFDFNDLEHFALQILDNKDCRKKARDKYKYIFYDEYQDSNDVQEAIIQKISSGDNLFFVGDVKQSIYRFRLAEPDIFRAKSKLYKQGDEGVLINLSENFRSKKNIIDFCNIIFEKIMKEEVAEIEYDENERLLSKSESEDLGDIQINILLDFEKKDDEEIKENLSDKELIAHLTARQINKLIKEKNFEYKDIMILRRSLKGYKEVYTKVFRDYEIPLFVDYSTAVFEVLEVSVFIDLLKIIDNMRQDEPLLAVLLSHIGGFSIEEITKIKISGKEEKYFHKIFVDYAKNNEDELSYKVKSFLAKLDEYVEAERHMLLDEYIEYLMKDSLYRDFVSSMPKGDIRVKNLDIVVEKAREFMKYENKSLFYFLMYIKSILKNKSDDTSPSPISSQQNMVRLMSIHKSKGLESKVVILNDLHKEFKTKDKEKNSEKEILLDSNYGIGARYIDSDNGFYMNTLPRKIVGFEYEKRTVAEEIRILYVALTRAKETLILNSVAKSGKDSGYLKLIEDIKSGFFPKELSKINRYQDFILYALADDIRNDFKDVSIYKFNEIDKNDFKKECISINEKEDNHDLKHIFEEDLKNTKLSPEDIKKISLNLIFEYGYSYDIDKLIKTSVTYASKKKENSKENKYIIEKIYPHDYYKKKSDFSPEKIGTLKHLFLQHINFKNDYTINDLEDMRDELVNKEFISLEESKVIDLKQIYNFLSSDLCKRIKKSDKIYQEESFIDDYDGMILSGVIDLFFEEDGEIVLLDYKSDNISIYNIDSYAKKMYFNQIQMYKNSISKAFGKNVKESYIYFLSVDNFVKF